MFKHSCAPPSFSITGAQKYQRCQSGEENDKARRQNAIKGPDRSFNRANRSIIEMEISFSFSQRRAESAGLLWKDNININASPSNMPGLGFFLSPGAVLKAALICCEILISDRSLCKPPSGPLGSCSASRLLSHREGFGIPGPDPATGCSGQQVERAEERHSLRVEERK